MGGRVRGGKEGGRGIEMEQLSNSPWSRIDTVSSYQILILKNRLRMFLTPHIILDAFYHNIIYHTLLHHVCASRRQSLVPPLLTDCHCLSHEMVSAGCRPLGPTSSLHHVRSHAVQYSTVQYSTVQYSTVQYSTVQYSNSSLHGYFI